MQRVIKVKFRNSGRVYFFDALDFEVHKGTCVIVDTARGNMLGECIDEPEEMDEQRLSSPLKPVIRLATEEDTEQLEQYRAKEPAALEACKKKVEEHGLEMKLVEAEYAYNGSKLTFYFTAENRVDFRELLKDLTGVFRTRIDLRQIGDRDEAKKCGGLGFCGRPVCCNTFLTEFNPVSIKMAKTQNLSLNPLKISGICGKLMCCLRYEQESYESMQKMMPKVGKEFVTPDGVGVVLENNVIAETTKVKVTLADGTLDVRSYPFRELVPKEAEQVCSGCEACAGCSAGANPPSGEIQAEAAQPSLEDSGGDEKHERGSGADKPSEHKHKHNRSHNHDRHFDGGRHHGGQGAHNAKRRSESDGEQKPAPTEHAPTEPASVPAQEQE